MDHHVFLSYAAEDRETARRVAESLERDGWRVWWDQKIEPGVAYDEAIEQALRQARCVVVLWSPHAIASRWVRAEASEAASRNILVPVLLREVTVPLEFRLFQAITLDTADAGGTAAAIAAITDAVGRIAGPAGPLAVTAPALAPVRRSRVALVLMLTLLPFVAAGVWWWDGFYREQTDYYANVTSRHGFPEGVGRLTAASVSARSVSIAIVRRGRRHPAHEIRIVNSDGNIPPSWSYAAILSMLRLNPLHARSGDGPDPIEDVQVTRVLFSRDATGRILEQAGLTSAGRRVYTLHFATPDLGEYKRSGFVGAMRESGIAYVRISRAADGQHAGLEERVVFLDARRQPQADEDGAYGYRQVLNADGLRVERIYLGADGTDHANAIGVLKDVREHDHLGNVTSARMYDSQGKPAAPRSGIAAMALVYDAVGNLAGGTFYDVAGQATPVPTLGAAGFTYTYDRGRVASLTFIGPDQKPTTGRDGFARRTIEWPSSTRSVSRFFGPTGRPVIPPGLAFEVVEEWNDVGLAIEGAFHDEQGQPTRLEDACSIYRMRYDDVGNNSEFRCLNEQGAPTLTREGYATLTSSYDDAGRRVMATMYDAAGRPGILNNTYSSVRRSYTAAGNIERLTFLGADGTAVRTRSGAASFTYEYDARGNQVRTTVWDATGQRTSHIEGYSSIRSTFDARRLEVERELLDTRDAPATSSYGWSRMRLDYDAQGLLIGQQFYDRRGAPARYADGYAAVRFVRNTKGLSIETRYLDERGRPLIAARYGAAIFRFTLDPDGRVVEVSSHDTLGRLVTNAYGYSTLRHHYDEHGRETGRSVLDTAGRPLPHVVAIDRVAPASFGEEVGFRAGDIFTAYDGEKVVTSDQFTTRLERFRGDRQREVRVRRADRILSMTVPPGQLTGLELAERVDAP